MELGLQVSGHLGVHARHNVEDAHTTDDQQQEITILEQGYSALKESYNNIEFHF